MQNPAEEILNNAMRDNHWIFDRDLLTLDCDEYQIDLEEIQTSAAALDVIVQVSKKIWATPKIVGDTVRLLDAVLDFQGSYCSFKVERGPVIVEQQVRRRLG